MTRRTRHYASGLGIEALSQAERERAEQVEVLREQADADAITVLVEMLTDPSWAVRREVVAALATLGEPAVEPLVTVLESRRDSERRIAAAVDALAESVAETEDAIIALAQHPDPAVAADAAQILGRRHARGALETLVSLTRHDDDNVAVAALEALGRIGGRAAVDTLVETIRQRNFFRTFPAIDVLGRSGDPRAVGPLSELLAESHYTHEAARALGRTGDSAAVAPLCELLCRSSDATVRVACAALHELNDRHRQRFGDAQPLEELLRRHVPAGAVRSITRALSLADRNERLEIAWVLGSLGDEEALPDLANLLEDEPVVAAAAAEALGRISRAGLDQVREALRSGDSEQRKALLPVLVSRLRVSDSVEGCLDDPDPAVRAAACDALARVASPTTLPRLFASLGDRDLRVVQSATGAIQSIGGTETERLALSAARSGDPRVRRAAFRILSYFGFSSALELFLETLDNADDPQLVDAALQGLTFIEDPRALDAMLTATRHAESRVRAAAVRALAHARDEVRVISALLRALHDVDAWVRYYACQSLGKQGFLGAVEPIAALLEDPAGQVRVGAIEALSHFGSAQAREVLLRAARASEPDVQRAALLGLGMIRNPEDLATLREMAQHPDMPTRLVAISAIASFQGPTVLAALAEGASDPDESVHNAAIGFLGARQTADATTVLVKLLRERRTNGIAEELLLGALSVFSAGRVRGLLDALAHVEDEELAPLLSSALARMNHPEARAALVQALGSASSAGRKAAAATLAGLGGRDVQDALYRSAHEDPDPEVRRVCAAALAR